VKSVTSTLLTGATRTGIVGGLPVKKANGTVQGPLTVALFAITRQKRDLLAGRSRIGMYNVFLIVTFIKRRSKFSDAETWSTYSLAPGTASQSNVGRLIKVDSPADGATNTG